MGTWATDFWTDETSVLFTSFWGWSPETWGTVGWTGDRGRTRRANLLRELTDPFITVIYVTGNQSYIEKDLQGKIAGFYLVSHETGDRDQFTHPIQHGRWPEKWRHSLRAIRAFSYIPEKRLTVAELDPELLPRARHVAAMCVSVNDPQQIQLLRETPWVEVDVYSGNSTAIDKAEPPARGMVRAGPENVGGYVVSATAVQLERQLYVLRLDGDTNAYIGQDCKGCGIFKVGLSISPDLRRQDLQRVMPEGAFNWRVYRTTKQSGFKGCPTFDAAVAGENAMKRHLAKAAEWLGGEFYLAKETDIEEAWSMGHAAIASFGRNN